MKASPRPCDGDTRPCRHVGTRRFLGACIPYLAVGGMDLRWGTASGTNGRGSGANGGCDDRERVGAA